MRKLLIAVVLIGAAATAQSQDSTAPGAPMVNLKALVPPPAPPAAGAAPAPAGTPQPERYNPCRDRRHPKISLLGDGYAQLVELKETAASVGIGVAYESPREEGSLFMKKGSVSAITNDPRAFGQSMLTPASANVAATALFRMYPFCRLTDINDSDTSIGLSGFFQGGSVDWTTPDPTDATAPALTKNAFVYAVGIGIPIRIWPSWLTANAIRVTMTPSLTMRGVSGDVGGDAAFRAAALGRTTKAAWGTQLEVELRINEVFATATMSQLSGHVPGLSGGQFVMAIGFRGGIDLGKEIPLPQPKP